MLEFCIACVVGKQKLTKAAWQEMKFATECAGICIFTFNYSPKYIVFICWSDSIFESADKCLNRKLI